MGKYTDLDLIERAELIELLDEQDLYPDRLNPELRAKIKELFGADIIVLGKVWSKYHIALINFVLPWNWKEVIFEHWFIRMRMVDADTGQILSSYYLRDDDGWISLGLNEYYLSESIERLISKMSEDFQKR